MRVLRSAIAGVLVASAVAAEDLSTEAILPPPEKAPEIAQNCSPLITRLAASWGDVTQWTAVYVWASPIGDLLGPRRSPRADIDEHYCVRLALISKRRPDVRGMTFLCSVNSRGSFAETWTFGNAETAGRLCPLSESAAATMDRRHMLFEQSVPISDAN